MWCICMCIQYVHFGEIECLFLIPLRTIPDVKKKEGELGGGGMGHLLRICLRLRKKKKKKKGATKCERSTKEKEKYHTDVSHENCGDDIR